MAKAKKSEKSETKSEAKSAAKKAAPKPAAKKKPASPTAPAGAPMVDTNLAAQAAARMLAAGVHAKPAQQKPEASQPQAKNESALFKQLKAGLHKPAASTMGGLLDKSGGPIQKKPNQPFGGKQVGHNQTFGADVTRSGVPRRTSG